MNTSPSLEHILNTRRSVRKYDMKANFDHQAVQKSLELATLSPNSSNMQMWAFHRVISEKKRHQLADICMGQNAAKTANELIVVTVTPNIWKQRAEMNAETVRAAFAGREDNTTKRALKYYDSLIPTLYNNDRVGLRGIARKLYTSWIGRKKPMVREVSKEDVRVCLHKSAALASMTFMLSMREQGYDTCPMEGFDSRRAKQLLGLDERHEITMIISCGVGAQDGVYGERHRVPMSEVVFEH
ncbi:nitroreductase [Vibrio sp. 10N.286.49.C2]|uniref:nitroreductase family protein n=1 Tax=unclassified Vibrio TaxID=2614977 RepID=UPI000C84D484|nr:MULTISPECIES: nitroreductase family protein [unclassified Vibrio]PMH35189.1 nitroreductase [Vibrio sp. 10N.286.49.C2]PMH57132.1 nitroreductase [Vibrio sp. 10N.286.49.B1]PMH82356.1 nitroreductase [Vibrio sp. 10N.286.48.B7]